MSKLWIQMFPSHQPADLLELKPSDIRTLDIAKHISQINRYTGGSRVPYCVAEHCVRVSQAIEMSMREAGTLTFSYTEEEIRACTMAGLFHDGSEAYTGDASNPVKLVMRFLEWNRWVGPEDPADAPVAPPKSFRSSFDELEERVQKVVCERYGLRYPFPAIVHHFDLVLLATEKRDLLGPPPRPWSIPPEVVPLAGIIEPWGNAEAEERWLSRFLQLGGVL